MLLLDRDGVRLSYQEVAGDKTPVLLVHGWCCDHTYFAPQFDHYAGKGRRVIAVDLRGHGHSDQPHQPYTMPVFADDLVWMCEQLAIRKPIIIGHSMGGIVAFDLAARYPDVPCAIIMLDAAVVLPMVAKAAIPAFIAALGGTGCKQAVCDYVGRSLFVSTDDPERKARILEQMSSTPQHVMISAFEGLRDYDPDEGAGGLRAPSLYIAADEAVPRSDMVRFQALAPQTLYGKTVGSGHFCQLEVPEQVNAMIDRFLTVSGLSADDPAG